MAELAVLTLIRNEVDDLHRAAERHDPAALAFWERLLGRAPGVGESVVFYTTARSNTRRIHSYSRTYDEPERPTRTDIGLALRQTTALAPERHRSVHQGGLLFGRMAGEQALGGGG
jgi:hypothetical protein